MRVTLKALHYFLTAVDSGSIAAAADKLNVAPAFHRAMRKAHYYIVGLDFAMRANDKSLVCEALVRAHGALCPLLQMKARPSAPLAKALLRIIVTCRNLAQLEDASAAPTEEGSLATIHRRLQPFAMRACAALVHDAVVLLSGNGEAAAALDIANALSVPLLNDLVKLAEGSDATRRVPCPARIAPMRS